MFVRYINWFVSVVAFIVSSAATGAELQIQDPLQMRTELLKLVPRASAITQVIGDGRGELFIIIDSMDEASRRLVSTLQQLPNATIRYYLAPNGAHDSFEQAQRIWCSRNRGQALLDAMLAERELAPPAARCNTSVLSDVMLQINESVMRSRPGFLTAKGLGVGVSGAGELASALLPFEPRRSERIPAVCAQYNEEGLPDCRR